MKCIDQIWMAVAVDPADDTEGVCAVQVGNDWFPLIAADHLRLPFVIEQATKISLREGKTVRLIKLSAREIISTLENGYER